MDQKKQTNVYDFLKKRGLIVQVTNEERIRAQLANPGVRFYLGFDPTAESLHIGHFLLLLVAHYLQEAGHQPYLLIGGGTAMVGDPSGRTLLRKMMDPKEIEHNSMRFKQQISHLISFTETEHPPKILNNAEWLLNLNWIHFLRTIGTHFSVNRMLAAEAFKTRFEHGLSFFEFNYMLMQAYDFFYLFNQHGVTLQIGGNDQWSNIIAGTELIRKIKTKNADGLTVPILTKSDGTKMGKTASGALWLDPAKVSPYEFYQYWINVNDDDVENYLKLLTTIDLEAIHKLIQTHRGKQMAKLKKILAFSITEMVHGKDQALLAEKQSVAAFEKNDRSSMYTIELKSADINNDPSIAKILLMLKQAKSKTSARKLIESGCVSVNEQKISDPNFILSQKIIEQKEFILFKGKKTKIRVILI